MHIIQKLNAYIKNHEFWIKHPDALTFSGLDEWTRTTKEKQPIAFFLTVTIPETCSAIYYRLIGSHIINFKSYVSCRFIDKYHIINTGLPSNEYHEFSTRSLHGMFNMLVDFVEVEAAWKSIWCMSTEDRKKVKGLTLLNNYWPYITEYRNPEIGLNHLKWEMTLDSDKLPSHEKSIHQAATAREIWDLYHWWKHIRPKRIDPMDASGWSEWCDNHKMKDVLEDQDTTTASRRQKRDILDRCYEIEQNYHAEDEAQLIRLVKIRQSIWT